MAAPAHLEAGAPRGRCWPPSEDTQESPAARQHRCGPQRRVCVGNTRPDGLGAARRPAGRADVRTASPVPGLHRQVSVAAFMRNFQLFRSMRLSSESLTFCTEQGFWKRFAPFPAR